MKETPPKLFSLETVFLSNISAYQSNTGKPIKL